MRRLLPLLCALAVAAAVMPLAGASAQPAEGTSRRLGDSPDAVLAAIDVSQETFADGSAEHVVLGRDDVFADSLAGAALARTTGPILYTTGGSDAPLRQETREEILRVLGPGRGGCADRPGDEDVYILGGTGAVPGGVTRELINLGYCLVRFAGESRVETSVNIAGFVADRLDAPQLLVARSDDWADAATGGAYAAAAGVPIVVTPTAELHPRIVTLLSVNDSITEAVLLGGNSALSTRVEQQLRNRVDTRRVSGPARDATASAIASALWGPLAPVGVTLVNGYDPDGWVYALAGAVPAARERAPQLYVQPDSLPEATASYLSSTPYRLALAIGPPALISEELFRAVAGAARPGPTPSDGPSPSPSPTPVRTLTSLPATSDTRPGPDPCPEIASSTGRDDGDGGAIAAVITRVEHTEDAGCRAYVEVELGVPLDQIAEVRVAFDTDDDTDTGCHGGELMAFAQPDGIALLDLPSERGCDPTRWTPSGVDAIGSVDPAGRIVVGVARDALPAGTRIQVVARDNDDNVDDWPSRNEQADLT